MNVVKRDTNKDRIMNFFRLTFERYAGKNSAVIPTINKNDPRYILLSAISTLKKVAISFDNPDTLNNVDNENVIKNNVTKTFLLYVMQIQPIFFNFNVCVKVISTYE